MLQPIALGTEHVSCIFEIAIFDLFVSFYSGIQRALPLTKASGRMC